MDRGWGIVAVHPWNLLGKFDLLFHPWKFDLFPRLDDLFVLRLKRLFQGSKSFEVSIVFLSVESPEWHFAILSMH